MQSKKKKLTVANDEFVRGHSSWIDDSNVFVWHLLQGKHAEVHSFKVHPIHPHQSQGFSPLGFSSKAPPNNSNSHADKQNKMNNNHNRPWCTKERIVSGNDVVQSHGKGAQHEAYAKRQLQQLNGLILDTSMNLTRCTLSDLRTSICCLISAQQ